MAIGMLQSRGSTNDTPTKNNPNQCKRLKKKTKMRLKIYILL